MSGLIHTALEGMPGDRHRPIRETREFAPGGEEWRYRCSCGGYRGRWCAQSPSAAIQGWYRHRDREWWPR